MEEFLRAQAALGTRDSKGEFTLDPAKAGELMGRVSLPDPLWFPLLFVACASSIGAHNVELRLDRTTWILEHDGPPPAQLADVPAYLFSRSQPSLRYLAWTWAVALQVDPAGMLLETPTQAWDALCATAAVSASAPIGLRFTVRFPLLSAPQRRGIRAKLTELCAYGPCQIRLDGQRLPLPDFSKCGFSLARVTGSMPLPKIIPAIAHEHADWEEPLSAFLAWGEGPLLWRQDGLALGGPDLGVAGLVIVPSPGLDLSLQSALPEPAVLSRLHQLRIELARRADSSRCAQWLEEDGRDLESLELRRQLVASRPGSQGDRMSLIRLLIRLGRHPEARAELESLPPTALVAKLLLDCACHGETLSQAALETFLTAVEGNFLTSPDLDFWKRLCSRLVAEGEPEYRAHRQWLWALESCPGSAVEELSRCTSRLTLLARRLRRPLEADNFRSRALELWQKYPDRAVYPDE